MDWAQFRTHFPVTRRWAFFDHAAVAPLSQPAADAMNAYAADLAENGVQSFERWEVHVEEIRKVAARLINADPLDVAFVANTTTGIGLVAEGFRWQPGDNVITAAEEYPSNQYPWMNLREHGVEVRSIPSRGSRIDLDDVRGLMDARTRVLAISAVEFASGFRNNLDALSELCRKNGTFFFVDAIQSLGVIPLDVQQAPIDGLAADGHKWMLGPEGAGIFWLRREAVEKLHPIGVGWNSVIGAHNFGVIDFRLKPHAGRFEGGTYNVAGITGLGASLQLLLDAGVPALQERVFALTDYLCDQAQRAGLEIFSSRTANEKSGIVSLVKRGGSHHELKKRCREAGVAINVRAGRLRVSPHAYNTFEEIDRFIECVR